jgi:hypothetical protein
MARKWYPEMQRIEGEQQPESQRAFGAAQTDYLKSLKFGGVRTKVLRLVGSSSVSRKLVFAMYFLPASCALVVGV